jgi:RimJ/RimL family protein N-acetyltransferase
VFVFEPLTERDLPFLLEVRNGCRNLLHDDRVFTLEECRSWFRESRPEFQIIRYAGERIGYFRLSNRNLDQGSLYVGADLHERFRGRGLAKRAYEQFFSMLKGDAHVAVVRLEVLSHNLVAHSLYKKLGFVEVGKRSAVAVRDGQSVDSIVMEKTL